MKRSFFFVLASVLSISIASPVWAQAGGAASGGAAAGGAKAGANTGAPQGGAPGPAQTGAAANNAAGPNQTGAIGNNAAGPNQTAARTGGAGPNQTGAGQNFQQPNGTQGTTPQFGLNGIPQSPFFANPNVRQQLRMNDRQFNDLNQRYTVAQNRYTQSLTALNNNASLTPAQRQARIRELRRTFNSDFGRNLDATFTDRTTRERYNQLNRQFEGFAAFDDPAIQQQMNLNPTQLQQLEQLQQNYNQELQALRQGSPEDRSMAAQQFAQLRANMATQLTNVLTPQQQQQWSQLTGTPMNFGLNDFVPATNGQRLPGNTQQVPAQPVPGEAPLNEQPQGTQPQNGQTNPPLTR